MKMIERRKLLADVARMAYLNRMSHVQIANQIKKSSAYVGRLLREAENTRIVKHTIALPRLSALEDQLKLHFTCLKEAIIVSAGDDYEFQLQLLGSEAATYFDKCVEEWPKAMVGISGGRTLYEMVRALPHQKRAVTLCPTALIGVGPLMLAHIDPIFLISRLWHKSHRVPGTAYCATVEPFAPTKKSERERRIEYQKYREGIVKNGKIKTVWEAMQRVDIVFASVGSMPPPEEYPRNATILELLKDIGVTQESLKNQGVIGDISYEFFDLDGNTKRGWNYFLTLNIDHYRRMAQDSHKKVVVIGGKYKVDALRAVLTGKLCNVLITDETTSSALLKDPSPSGLISSPPFHTRQA